MNILFIGEQSIDTSLLKQLEREFPHSRVSEARWPEGLDAWLGNGPIDVAIVDQGLGWSGGLAVSSRIKAENPECIVVLLAPSTPSAGSAGGIDHWLGSSGETGTVDTLLRSLRNDVQARAHIPRLTAAREHLAAIVESSEDAIISKNLSGTILSWNSSAERIFGYAAEEAIGTPITVLIPPERRHEEDEIIARIRRGERLDHFETVRVGRDGRRIDVSETISPIRNDTGEIVGASKIVRDISDKKRLENELKLRMKELAEADDRKNQFLAMLAHELRNPLAPIRNAIEVLKVAGPPDPMLIQAQDMIERQVGNMVRMIDDLLDLTRIARGKIRMLRERIDLTELVRTCVADHEPILARAGLNLETHLPDRSLHTYGDPTRIIQAVSNVIQNAVKFTDPGGAVTVSMTEEDNSAVLSIRDTGIGVDPAMVDRIFDTFIQVDQAIDRSRGGLGLGLALVKQLVELHRGQVRARSAGLGRGTEITLTLPLRSVPGPEDVAPPPPEVKPGGHRILIIEDNADAAESLKLILQLHGHEVHVAHSGAHGLNLARRAEPGIVLCDIGLAGGMDGHAVARAFRADPKLKDVFLVAVSGYGQLEDQQQSLAAGFNVHLTKPVEVEELERTFAELERGGR